MRPTRYQFIDEGGGFTPRYLSILADGVQVAEIRSCSRSEMEELVRLANMGAKQDAAEREARLLEDA